MNNCPACQSENAEGVILCKKCGLQFSEKTVCAGCQTENTNEDRAERSWNYGANDINNTYAWALAIVPLVFAFITNRITDDTFILIPSRQKDRETIRVCYLLVHCICMQFPDSLCI